MIYIKSKQILHFTSIIPNFHFNKFPEWTVFTNYIKNRKMGQFKELKGGYLDINIFLRGGKIIPFQNNSNISSTNDLRYEKTSIIINPDQDKHANGHIIFDNDEVDPIGNKTYLHIEIFFNINNIKFTTHNLGKKYNDHNDDIIDDWSSSLLINAHGI